jgi:hypothetical protein
MMIGKQMSFPTAHESQMNKKKQQFVSPYFSQKVTDNCEEILNPAKETSS